MIHGFLDARELADVLDIRASTVRNLVETNNPLIPKPVYLLDSKLPHWPVAAVKSWLRQGEPCGWEYDATEFVEAAIEVHERCLAASGGGNQ